MIWIFLLFETCLFVISVIFIVNFEHMFQEAYLRPLVTSRRICEDLSAFSYRALLTYSFLMNPFILSPYGFWCFQGVEKGRIGNKWVKKGNFHPSVLLYLSSVWYIFTRLFPMHPFSTSWKYKKILRFSGVFRG